MAATEMTPSGPPILEMRSITKDFPGVRALEDVSLDVRSGEIHALVGENGAGKSTLIKILGGVYPHGSFAGKVLLEGRLPRLRTVRDAERAGIAVIHQELALVKHMTVGENLFLGDEPGRWGLVDWDRLYRDSRKLLSDLDLGVNERVSVLSLGVGAQQLVEIAKSLRKESRVLVLDEPTAALSDHEVRTLFRIMRRLRSQGVALIYISHKLEEVLEIADRITVLRDGKVVGSGDLSEWTRGGVIRAMVGRDLAQMFPKVEHRPGSPVLEVEGLSVEDPDVSGRVLLKDISFQVRSGEILGIAGLMGAGRTELVSTLFGAAPAPWSGTLRVNGHPVAIRSPQDAIAAGLALVPEDRKEFGLVSIASVAHNLSMAHLREFCLLGVVDQQREVRRCRLQADELDIRATSLHDPAETLSGGNQQKTVLGKWLLKRPRVLFLDEPTHGIDVGAKAEIHRLMGKLTSQGMAVVMVSSELPEVLGVADRILVLRRGRVSAEFDRKEATAEGIMHAAV